MMTYKEEMTSLCREQTDLTDLDIAFLITYATDLMTSSNYQQEDVFIDVKNAYSDDATVIFHKRPKHGKGLYERTVVGNTATLQNEPAVIRSLNTGVPSVGLSAISQEGIKIQQTVFPVIRDKQVIAALILEKDASQVLDNPFLHSDVLVGDYAIKGLSLEQVAVFEALDDAVLVFDNSGRLLYCNQMAVETYRDKLAYIDSITGLHYDNLILGNSRFDQLKLASKQFTQAYHNQVEVPYGSYCFSVKQEIFPEQQLILMICRDITLSRQTQTQLLNMEVLLREMNHRIKNNLQTVVSLLRLQAQRSQDIEVKKSLYDSINRVLSIATTHELLSLQNSDTVLVDELLQGVIGNVQHCFQGRLDINFTYRLQPDVILDSHRATSVALVINELLQNSYDHAFNDLSQKNQKIHLQVSLENDIIKIELYDNGSGYDTNETFDNCLGLMIVDRFVKSKLSGKLFVQSNEQGTLTRITFKYK